MKKWGVLLLTLLCVAALCLSLVGCADKAKEEPEEAPVTTTTEPEGMTEAKAIELACQYWGVRNGETVKDEQHVQRMINVSVVGYPTEEMPYYVVLLSRQSGDDSWTSLTTVTLDAETGDVITE